MSTLKPNPPPAGTAEAPGAASARLATLAAEYWEGALKSAPSMATAIGDRRYDAELEDLTPEGRAQDEARLRAQLAAARAFKSDALSPADRITQKALIEVIEGDLSGLECDFHSWLVDPLEGPQVGLLNFPAFQSVGNESEARAMVSRWRRMGPFLDVHIDNLRVGLETDRVAVTDQVRRALAQIDDLLGKPDAEWPLLDPARTRPAGLSPAEHTRFAQDLLAAVAELIRPAMGRYRNLLAQEIAPRARPSERPGVMHIPGGPEAYRKRIKAHTSLDLSPEAIHHIGREELTRLRAEIAAVGRRLLGTEDVAEIFRRLRSEAQYHFSTREQVEGAARDALARAQAAAPRWFGRLPHTPCEVVRMEAHEEKHGTLAYYRQPSTDGTRPGRYHINTYDPEHHPRYIAEPLAFHEAVPGHHLQVALAQELADIPTFRRHVGITAYFEGWALYAEDLAVEMGLYSGDLDLIGKLGQEAWRAARLVVDTGLHGLGWTRDQAIQVMRDNTGESESNVVNEVDRYITWPGQALAYKLGQLEIARLRRESEARLGARFDIRRFHDAILAQGAVGLPLLRELIAAHDAAGAGAAS